MTSNKSIDSWLFFTSLATDADVREVRASLDKIQSLNWSLSDLTYDQNNYRHRIVKKICGCLGSPEMSYPDYLRNMIDLMDFREDYAKFTKNIEDCTESMEQFLMSSALSNYIKTCDDASADAIRSTLKLVNKDRKAMSEEIMMKGRSSKVFKATLPVMFASGAAAVSLASSVSGMVAASLAALSGPFGIIAASGVAAVNSILGRKTVENDSRRRIAAELLPTTYVLIRIRLTVESSNTINNPGEAVRYVRKMLQLSRNPQETANDIRNIILQGVVQYADPHYSAVDYKVFLEYGDDILRLLSDYIELEHTANVQDAVCTGSLSFGNLDSHYDSSRVEELRKEFEQIRVAELRAHEMVVSDLMSRINELEREIAELSFSKKDEGYDDKLDMLFKRLVRKDRLETEDAYKHLRDREMYAVREIFERTRRVVPDSSANLDEVLRDYDEQIDHLFAHLLNDKDRECRDFLDQYTRYRKETVSIEHRDMIVHFDRILLQMRDELASDVEQGLLGMRKHVEQRLESIKEEPLSLSDTIEIYDRMLHGIRHNLAPLFAEAMRPYKDYLEYPEDGFPVDDVPAAVRSGDVVDSVLRKAGLMDFAPAEPVDLVRQVRDMFNESCPFTVIYADVFPIEALIKFSPESLSTEVLGNVRTNIEDHAFGHFTEDMKPVSQRHVHVSLRESREYWSLVIKNDGEPFPDGIDPNKVFEYGSYYDESNSNDRGTGMFFLERAVHHYGGNVQFRPMQTGMYTVEYEITFKK